MSERTGPTALIIVYTVASMSSATHVQSIIRIHKDTEKLFFSLNSSEETYKLEKDISNKWGNKLNS